MESMLAHADVLDSIQMDDRGLQDSVESGVLYSCVLPGSGNIIGGTSVAVKLKNGPPSQVVDFESRSG